MSALYESPQAAVTVLWWATLVLGLVVVLVVGALLAWIHREARLIHARVSAIWTVGQQVANNTIHIPDLYATNAIAARILAAVERTGHAASGIEQHARACPGCPQCLFRS